MLSLVDGKDTLKSSVAIVGGGVFGTTAAWTLADRGHKVDLYERHNNIFQEASGINQYRIHRGYHYPRSIETILTCRMGEEEFRKTYPECVIDGDLENYYSISKEKSLINKGQILDIWSKCNLEFSSSNLDCMNITKIDESFLVKECIFDPYKLREIVWRKLKQYEVNVILNNEIKLNDLDDYDFVVIATYSSNNILTDSLNITRDYQFEICEKLVCKLHPTYQNKSVVIIDGPFMCIDPLGNTGFHVMGNVEHAIHHRNIGLSSEIPSNLKPLLNKGIIEKPEVTNYIKFIETFSEFFNYSDDIKHIGSMFTIRAVLPMREHDDARPTLVEQIDDRIVTLFSGKIVSCIDSANEVIRIVEK
tara:strand:+ start:1675 stop:2760 length:1086 start_codon:yes stop_codon:yes gene_type:complete